MTNGEYPYKLYTPDGVQDFTLEQCYAKREIESRIRTYLRTGGYEEIETPSIEYYDVFAASGTIAQESMYKFTDQKGRLLVLRPDMTVPAARFYASGQSETETVRRFFYIGNVYRYHEAGGGRTREFTQAGVEIIGAPGPQADAEAISEAIRILQGTGLTAFQIDLGQVEFFKGLIEEAALDAQDGETVRQLVDRKNYADLELFLRQRNIDEAVRSLLLELPMLFGGRDVLDRAERLTAGKRARAAIAGLRTVLDILADHGLAEYVTVDLGLVNSLNYYTGVVFKGFASGIGFPVLSGGRYDRLLENYGVQAAATGFCLGVNLLMQAMERRHAPAPGKPARTFLGYDAACRRAAFAMRDALRREGRTVIPDLQGLSEEEGYACAKREGCDVFLYLRPDGTVRTVQIAHA